MWRIAPFLSVLAFLIAGCSPVGMDGSVEMYCNPTPSISGTPPGSATVGVAYTYYPDASWTCFPFVCDGVVLLSGPAGAVAEGDTVYWTPTEADSGQMRGFVIRTATDSCGDSVRQSWLVTVFPAPLISSFTATPQALNGPGTVVLTPVFSGGIGYINGVGPVSSGQNVEMGVVSASTTFTLSVTNEAGYAVTRTVTVPVLTPPRIDMFSADKAVVTAGDEVELHWIVTGDYSKLTLDPGGLDVTAWWDGAVMTPSADTTYTLTAENVAGGTDEATVDVRAVPPPVIDSFTASPESAPLGETVTLTPVFHGGVGTLWWIGTVESGSQYTSLPLEGSDYIGLTVTNEAGSYVQGWVYITATGPGTFQKAPGVPLVPTRRSHGAVLLDDSRVFIAGGRALPLVLNSTELFDPVTGTFSSGPNLLKERYNPAMVKLNDGRVLIAGGFADEPFRLISAEVYDPVEGTIASLGDLPVDDIVSPEAVLLPDGKALIVSSWGNVIFDPETGSFANAAGFNETHSCLEAALLSNGKVLAADGTTTTSSELYDADSGTWSPTGTMDVSRCYFALTPLDGQGALVAGGGSRTGKSIAYYDPVSGTFSEMAQSLVGLGSPRAVQLNDGRVLLAGGVSYPDDPMTAQVVNPTDWSVEKVGKMLCNRTDHTATRLPDGRVFIMGGCYQAGPNPSFASEIFEP